MGAKLDYYAMAENDYQFLKDDYDRGRFGNVMCYCAQDICERYLKHVIDVYVLDVNTTDVLKTHSIRNLKRFLMENLPDFVVVWDDVLPVNGYYYDARYPGVDAIITNRQDTEECWLAVTTVRDAVNEYLAKHPRQNDVSIKGINISSFDE